MSEKRIAGAVMLALHTVAALVTLPFAVVLALYSPMLVGSTSRPDGPLVILVTLALLVLPFLLLAGPIGAWVSWVKRRTRPAVIFALAPVVYGILVVLSLSVFVG